MMLKASLTILIVLGVAHPLQGQLDFSGQNPQSRLYQYKMDSHAECGKTFEIGMTMAAVYGKGAIQTTGSPTSCTITLSSDGIRERRILMIEVNSAIIRDQGVSFYIYDGQWTQASGAQQLASYGWGKPPPANMKPLQTSGGTVTFSLTKTSPELFNFDIIITVRPISADTTNPNNCDSGAGYGCENYYYNPVITKSEVTYIVAILFGIILVIIIPIIVIFCYRRQRGLNRKWRETTLKDGQSRTAASLCSSLGSLGTARKEPWHSQSSKQPFTNIRKPPPSSSRWSRPSTEDEESIMDDFPKRPAPPPPYEEHDRYDRYTRNGRNRRDDYDREREFNRPYRERGRRYSDRSETPPKDRYEDDMRNNSFVQADDDHPQDNFVERIITPRVRPKSAGKVSKSIDTKDDDGYDSIGNVVRGNKSDAEKTDSETQCNKESDSEDSPETETESGESSEEEASSADEQDPRKALYAQPDKAKQSSEKQKKGVSKPDQPSGPALQGQPRFIPPVHGVPYQARPQGIPAVIPRMPYPGHPAQTQGYRPPVGQIVRPAYTGPNQFRPVVQPQFQPSVHQRLPMSAGFIPNLNHPMQSHNAPVLPQQSHNAPEKQQLNSSNDPPKFSYLVQRGYDTGGRTSPISTSTSYSQRSYILDEAGVTLDLGSGVELMKRTTDV